MKCSNRKTSKTDRCEILNSSSSHYPYPHIANFQNLKTCSKPWTPNLSQPTNPSPLTNPQSTQRNTSTHTIYKSNSHHREKRRIYISRHCRLNKRIGFIIMSKGSMVMVGILRGSHWDIIMGMREVGRVGWSVRMRRVRSWRKVIPSMEAGVRWTLWRSRRVVMGRRSMIICRNHHITTCIE